MLDTAALPCSEETVAVVSLSPSVTECLHLNVVCHTPPPLACLLGLLWFTPFPSLLPPTVYLCLCFSPITPQQMRITPATTPLPNNSRASECFFHFQPLVYAFAYAEFQFRGHRRDGVSVRLQIIRLVELPSQSEASSRLFAPIKTRHGFPSLHLILNSIDRQILCRSS